MLIDHLFSSLRNVCSHLFSVLFQPIDLWTQNPYNLQHSVCACESISHQKTPTRFSSDFCRRAEALCLDCSAFSQLSWNELVYKEFTSSLGRTGSLGGALFGPTSRPGTFPKSTALLITWVRTEPGSAAQLRNSFVPHLSPQSFEGFDFLRPLIGNKSSINFSCFSESKVLSLSLK